MIMSKIFRLEEGDSLVNYYLLPLLGVNKNIFGRHFVNSYIDKQGLKIYVKLSSNMTSPIYNRNPNFVTTLVVKDHILLQFVLPTNFHKDAQLFLKGKYSHFSKDAKKKIYATSTLPYNATAGSFKVSHPALQALDRTKTLRAFLSDLVGVKIHPEDELMSPPKDFYFIENLLK